MPLPLSSSAIKRLGKRLAEASEPEEADLDLLEEIVQAHSEVLTVARARVDDFSEIAEWGSPAITHRAKTTQTIVEKLRRQPNMDLARMQDLAGIRLVGAFTLAQQDQLTAEIVSRFPPDPRESRTVDRRVTPSWGYRAVHVVVSVDGFTVEVQIRTQRQHVWANLTERIGDQIGRGIRYGESVQVSDEATAFLDMLTEELGLLSDRLYAIEQDPNSTPLVMTATGFEPVTAVAVEAFMQRVLPDEA
jgi:ppGpp synthetase/RelA/SpoT-type nucleotidyltranferase